MKYSHTTTNIDDVAYLVCMGFEPVAAHRSSFTTRTGVSRPTAMFTLEGPIPASDAMEWLIKRTAKSKVKAGDFIEYRKDAKRVIDQIINHKRTYLNLKGE